MFLNPIMLVGLGAAVIPLVLHLLSRARYRDVEWGAMMFLDSADSHSRRTTRFAQVLLLLTRSALIAVTAAALARPVFQGKWTGKPAGGRVTAALLLDCSGSMTFDENGRTRFEMAQAAARQIIRGLRPGDRISLILMGCPNAANDLEPTGDLRSVEAKIDDARAGYGRANLAESLGLASQILGRYEKFARDVYVVCDRQALSWHGVDGPFTHDWKARMRGPGVNTRFFVLPVGSNDADNIAVDSARLLNAPAIAGQPTDIEVMVHNYGPVQHAAAPVSLEGTESAVPDRVISLAPGQTAAVPFTVTLKKVGSQVLTARVKGAGYTDDNSLDIAVDVIPPIEVLIISGDEQQGQFRSESDFLKWALAPHKSMGGDTGDPCNVTVMTSDKWSAADLPKYQVVVLANVERFTPQQAHALEKHVFSGGRLLIAPGSLSRVDDYNALLYRDGAGVLPAMLEPPTAPDGSESTSLLGMQLDHPVFQFLRGRFEIPSATIVRYFPTIPRQVDADVLSRYLSNDPFLIEGRSERGRVLLMTTAVDADWSTLPLSNFYLPFMQSAIRYLAGGTVGEGNLAAGYPIRLTLDDAGSAPNVTLTRPDGRRVKLEVMRLEKQAEVRYADTEAPGAYRLEVQETGKPLQMLHYIVRAPREESDLTQLSEDQWRAMERSLGFSRVDPTVRPVTETLAVGREGRELWGPALAAVGLLLSFEMLTARLVSVRRRNDERLDDFAEAPTAPSAAEPAAVGA